MESCNKESSFQLRCGLQKVKRTSRNEYESKENGPKKIKFELKNESDSFEEE